MKNSKTLISFFAVLTIILSLPACKARIDETDIKDYRLFYDGNDDKMRQMFSFLISDFNNKAGFDALKFVSNKDQSNSTIVVTEGLRQKSYQENHKENIGWGQWILDTKEKVNQFDLNGQKVERQRIYSMRVEFDAEYLRTNLNKGSTGQYANEKLFFHEVGHGLMMDHDEQNVQNVMYPSVDGNKDIEGFFLNVRRFFKR